MVIEIEVAPEQSLILIEEIENGLHPVATVRLVEYLIEVAERKKIQAIFTTHSNSALLPLPAKAIWAATNTKIFQGKLDVESLRAIVGQVDAELIVFVEDRFAKIWMEAILRQENAALLESVQVHPMEGDGMAVGVNKFHNLDPSSSIPSICLIDGDSKQKESKEEFIFRLPGNVPESTVFDEVIEKADAFGGKLSVALLQQFDRADAVLDACRQVRLTCRDSHLLFAQVGDKIGLIPEGTVAAAFATIWSQAYPDKARTVRSLIKDRLDQVMTSKKATAPP